MAAPYTPELFWAKVVKTETCWIWQGNSDNGRGYFSIMWAQKRRYVHRVAWELVNGPIPDGLQIDHLCRNKRCVNPTHLEPVTGRINKLRGNTITRRNAEVTHCVRGHPYDKENTIVGTTPLGTPRRACRKCRKLYRMFR